MGKFTNFFEELRGIFCSILPDVGDGADVCELCELVLHQPGVDQGPEQGLHHSQARPHRHAQGKPASTAASNTCSRYKERPRWVRNIPAAITLSARYTVPLASQQAVSASLGRIGTYLQTWFSPLCIVLWHPQSAVSVSLGQGLQEHTCSHGFVCHMLFFGLHSCL